MSSCPSTSDETGSFGTAGRRTPYRPARAPAAGGRQGGTGSVPESALHVLRGDLAGKDGIELGGGTAYVSCWLARRGARMVGIDNSEAQLATARRYQREHGLEFPLIHG